MDVMTYPSWDLSQPTFAKGTQEAYQGVYNIIWKNWLLLQSYNFLCSQTNSQNMGDGLWCLCVITHDLNSCLITCVYIFTLANVVTIKLVTHQIVCCISMCNISLQLHLSCINHRVCNFCCRWNSVSTPWGWMMHICFIKLTHHWWNIVNWTLRYKVQSNLNQNSYIFINNAFENFFCEMATILPGPQCANIFIRTGTCPNKPPWMTSLPELLSFD